MSRHGGKITDLSSDDVERVIVALLNEQYLADDYNATAYSVNVYVKPGKQAIRLTRLSEEDARKLTGVVDVNLSSKPKKARKSGGGAAAGSKSKSGSPDETKKKSTNGARASGSKSKKQNDEPKKTRSLAEELDDLIDSDEEEAAMAQAEAAASAPGPSSSKAKAPAPARDKQRPISEMISKMAASRNGAGTGSSGTDKKPRLHSSSDDDFIDDEIEVGEDGWQVMPAGFGGSRGGVKDEPIEID